MAKKIIPATATELKALGCTSLKLRQLTRCVSQHYDQEMAVVGLKTTQYSLLSHVQKLGPVRPGELALSMKLEASTLTRNLKPLMDAGWLAMQAGTDARSRLVTITDAGRAKREEARRHWKAAQESMTQRLGADRVIALHQLINESMAALAGAEESLETDD